MPRSHYSPRVSLRLIVGGEEIPLASVGRESCIARSPVRHMPESDACLVIDVGGDAAKYFVRLEQGISANSQKIPFSAHTYIPLEYARVGNEAVAKP
jgi:hypothetical protein